MQPSDKKALEITTQIVVARMQNTTINATKDGGTCVAEFFKAIFEGVKEITSTIEN